MSYQDRTLTCVDCSQDFTWTAGEQEFYVQRGLTNEPRRCPDCRRARKAQQGGGGGGGGYASGGGYSGGSYSSGGGYDRPQRQMFETVCSQCGKATQVPFQPRGDKPVYCSDCFAERRQSSSGGYGGGSYGSRDRY